MGTLQHGCLEACISVARSMFPKIIIIIFFYFSKLELQYGSEEEASKIKDKINKSKLPAVVENATGKCGIWRLFT